MSRLPSDITDEQGRAISPIQVGFLSRRKFWKKPQQNRASLAATITEKEEKKTLRNPV